jgi:peptide-methionine (S)-S-oxide reductase
MSDTGKRFAIFAGGCFWCTEPVFSQLKGVYSVASGYTGGNTQNPTYEQICTGNTGHAEAIRIEFDPAEISFDTLVEIFLVAHDPTTRNRQGNDVGTQYRSAIFYLDEEQKTLAEQVIARFEATNVYAAPIVTEVTAASTFYPAESYHQQFFAKNPNQPYCLAVAAPKAAKIRQYYAQLVK